MAEKPNKFFDTDLSGIGIVEADGTVRRLQAPIPDIVADDSESPLPDEDDVP